MSWKLSPFLMEVLGKALLDFLNLSDEEAWLEQPDQGE
jgi:hypothetical protein